MSIQLIRQLASMCAAMMILLAGCTSINVTRVDPDKPYDAAGIRYSLPKPCIRAVQLPSGEVTCEVVYLPDEENTYAIDVSGLMDDHAINVVLTEAGLLKRVEYASDTTVIPAKIAEAGGAIAHTSLSQLQAKREAELKANLKAQEDRASAISTLQGQLNTANDELLVLEETEADARADVAAAEEANKTPTDATKAALKTAQDALLTAQRNTAHKRTARDRLAKQMTDLQSAPLTLVKSGDITPSTPDTSSTGTFTHSSTFQLPATDPAGSNEIAKLKGASAPVLYAIVEGKRGCTDVVELHAIGVEDPQKVVFPGSQPSYPGTGGTTGSGQTTGDGSSSLTLTPVNKQIHANDALTVKSSALLKTISFEDTSMAESPAGSTLKLKAISPLENTQEFKITFEPGNKPAKGPYRISVLVTDAATSTAKQVDVTFELLAP